MKRYLIEEYKILEKANIFTVRFVDKSTNELMSLFRDLLIMKSLEDFQTIIKIISKIGET